jgi:hypothetical protein
MKVEDYVELGGDVFYVTKDLSQDDLIFNELEVLAIYVKAPSELYFVGKVCKIQFPKNSSGLDVVKPIFVKDEK